MTRHLATIALLGCLGWGCASSGPARGTWPEHWTSDYFRVAPEAAAGPGRTNPNPTLARPLQSNTSWSLAAQEWGPSGQGGFPTPEGLTPEELRRIDEGWTVARPFEFEVGGRDYVGGVAFQIVEAPTEDVLSALLDVNQIPLALPLTHRATLVARSGFLRSLGGDRPR